MFVIQGNAFEYAVYKMSALEWYKTAVIPVR